MPFSKGSTPGFQIPLPHKIYNYACLQALSTVINCLTLKRSVIPSYVLFQFFYLNILCGIVPITIDYLELYVYIILMQMIKIHRKNGNTAPVLHFFLPVVELSFLWTTKPQPELFLSRDVVALSHK